MKRFLTAIFIFNLLFSPVLGNITDEFVEQTLDKNLKIREYKPTAITDDFAESTITKTNTIKHKNNFDADNMFSIKATQAISTKNIKTVGNTVNFITLEDVIIQGKIFPKGTPVTGRIENISKRAFMGVPADMVISNFKIGETPLYGEISKTGKSKVLWLKPLSMLLTPFGGAGIGLMFIKGGHANIKAGEIFVIYY